MKLSHRFNDLLLNKKIVPFIGAGFSIPSGLPSWHRIVDILARDLSESPDMFDLIKKMKRDMTLIDLSEMLDSLSISEHSFYEKIKNIFSNERLIPNEYHDLLLELEFDTIVTTNWDLLIEKKLSALHKPYDKIFSDKEVPLYNPRERTQLIKLHGDVDSVNSIVYRKTQYQDFWKDKEILKSLFMILATTRNFLFLGYSLGDPNISSIIQLIKGKTAPLNREHYALVYDDDENMRKFWKDQGIKVIEAPGFDPAKRNYLEATINFLNSLCEESKQVSISNLDRARLINKELVKVLHKGLPSPSLRMRGALGWLSNPEPVEDDSIYGNYLQDKEEREMTENIFAILEDNRLATVKCILNINTDSLLSKYAPAHLKKRLQMLAYSIEKFPNQVMIAHNDTPSNFNQMIVDTSVTVQGHKRANVEGIQRVTLMRDNASIKTDIYSFDKDFADTCQANMAEAAERFPSAKTNNEYILLLIEAEIEKLGNRYNYKGFDLVAKALTLATIEHHKKGQTREDGKTAYAEHLVRVIEKLRTIGGITNYIDFAAAALHDILEDTDYSIEELETNFGREVTMLVIGMTHKPGDDMSAYLDQLHHSSSRVKAIKLADRLDNVHDLIRFRPASFGEITPEAYLANSQEVLKVCRLGNVSLANELELAIKYAKEVVMERSL